MEAPAEGCSVGGHASRPSEQPQRCLYAAPASEHGGSWAAAFAAWDGSSSGPLAESRPGAGREVCAAAGCMLGALADIAAGRRVEGQSSVGAFVEAAIGDSPGQASASATAGTAAVDSSAADSHLAAAVVDYRAHIGHSYMPAAASPGSGEGPWWV